MWKCYLSPLLDAYYQEGMRNPKFAYVEGENTGIVLIPITDPPAVFLTEVSNRMYFFHVG